MAPINTVHEVLLDKRDREVLRAASPVVAAGASPRKRWSPIGSGSPRKWSPTRWSPNRLSPSSSGSGPRHKSIYAGLDGDDDSETIKENTNPVTPRRKDTIDVFNGTFPSSPIHKVLPSPNPKPRFAMSTMRQRGLSVQPPSPISPHRKSESSSPAKDASPIFRFKLQTVGTGTEAILPGPDDTRNEEDDFDILVKERQQGSVKEQVDRTFDSVTATPPGISSRHLHEMCGNIGTLDDVLRAQTFVKGNPYHAAMVDLRGMTPLHIFSTNKILASAIGVPNEFDSETREFLRIHEQQTTDPEASQLQKHVLRFLIADLLPACPGAMLMRDDQSNIPFQKSLEEWVQESHQRGISNDAGTITTTGFSCTSAMNNMWESTMKMASRTSSMMASGFATTTESPTKVSNDMERGDSRSAIFSPERGIGLADANKSGGFHSFVKVTPQARFTLTMMSAVVDQLELYQSPKLLRQSRARQDANGESFLKACKGLKEFQHQYGSINIVDSIVEAAASIPGLMITILLIDDDKDREYVLSTSIMRRIMKCKRSVGPWLTKILQSRDRRLAQRAVDYLKMVSDELTRTKASINATRSSSSKRSSNQCDSSAFENDMIDEVSRLQDFVPSLLALSERGIEDASTTFIVKQVLNRMISRPFAATVILCDMLFLGILIVGFRYAVNKVISGAPLEQVLQCIYIANTGIFYFIIREIGKTVSLFQISLRARSYFLSFWNLIDALAVMFALASSICMRSYFTILENGIEEDTTLLRGLLAITTGFLWLRVLSLLKAINIQMATFVLAILQITKDIFWFCVILATLVVSFSQMFFTLLAPTSCATEDGTEMVCKPTEYLLRSYTILLGDFGTFEREQFVNGFSVFLIVCYSFLVTVVLLNVLIAIASDSYDKCLLRSQHLFGRARVMLIAELVAFQNLLRTTDYSDSSTIKQGLYSRWRASGRWIQRWSRASLLFFSLSMFVIAAWTLAELLGYAQGEQHANILFSLASVIVNVGLFSIIMAFLAAASANRDQSQAKEPARDGVVRGAMLRLLGVSRDPNDPHKGGDEDEWCGKVNYLQREMKRIADDHKSMASQQAKTMENLVNQTELRLKAELELLDDHFANLRDALLLQINGAKRTNQFVTIAVQELKQLMSVAASTAQTTDRTPVPSEVNVDQTRIFNPQEVREK